MSFSAHKSQSFAVCTVTLPVQSSAFSKDDEEKDTNQLRLSVLCYGLTSPPTCSTPQRNGRCVPVPPSLPFGSGGRI